MEYRPPAIGRHIHYLEGAESTWHAAEGPPSGPPPSGPPPARWAWSCTPRPRGRPSPPSGLQPGNPVGRRRHVGHSAATCGWCACYAASRRNPTKLGTRDRVWDQAARPPRRLQARTRIGFPTCSFGWVSPLAEALMPAARNSPTSPSSRGGGVPCWRVLRGAPGRRPGRRRVGRAQAGTRASAEGRVSSA